MVMRAWEISQVYKVFRGVCRFCTTKTRLIEELRLSVADDFGYVCLDKGKRELVNVVDDSKHNTETSHVQHPKQ